MLRVSRRRPPVNSGTAGRLRVYGPGFVNTDFRSSSSSRLPREGMRLDFRAEFFNICNHPQFGSPNPISTPLPSSEW